MTDQQPSRPAETRPTAQRGWVRRHKLLTGLLVLALLVGGFVGGSYWYVDDRLADIPRFEYDHDREGAPERVETEAVNILLLGADDPDGPATGPTLEELLDAGDWSAGAFRSDTTMVLHIEADRERAQLISIPRDSYVPIPGHGEDKINAAFSYGGPQLAAETVEDLTGVYLDHIVIVSFQGFVGITEVIGGVDVYVAETVHDSASGKTWEEGEHHIEGEEALLYVRQRCGLDEGDFDRVQRQQNFLRAVLAKVASTGTLANPYRVAQLLGELDELLAVDDGFTNGEMRDLATSSRGLRADDVAFATAPYLGTGTSPTGASIVLLDRAATRALFAAVAHDEYARWAETHEIEELPGPTQVD